MAKLKNPKARMSDREREVVTLTAIGSSIDDMVNGGLFALPDDLSRPLGLQFHSNPHQQLFSVLLADFLEPVDALLAGAERTPVALFKQICACPQFNEHGTIPFLQEPTDTLETWLAHEIVVDTYLPALDRSVNLTIARQEFIYICGTISKHNLGRLTKTARKFASILKRHELEVPHLDALRALDDFYVRFYDDILNYHATVLAEMLNNLRWGIHDYLRPTYMKALSRHKPDDLGYESYEYRYPEGVVSEFARTCFWDLMNDVRRGPLVGRFSTDPIFRRRY